MRRGGAAMMRTVVLHGALAQFGPTFDLDVKSPVEAIRALIVHIKGFRQEIREGHYRVLKAKPARDPEALDLRGTEAPARPRKRSSHRAGDCGLSKRPGEDTRWSGHHRPRSPRLMPWAWLAD